MTRVDARFCDVCGERIRSGFHYRLKRTLFSRFRLFAYRWGIVNINPNESGWIRKPPDFCADCVDDVVAELAERCEGGGPLENRDHESTVRGPGSDGGDGEHD